MHYDVIIIGGGIIGFSTAFQLLQKNPTLKVALLEKESDIGLHQTGHNSGVIHAGVYYPPGSLKAKFCLEGCQATKDFCTEYHIPFKVPGKLIVATQEHELVWMQSLMERCEQNGLKIEKLNAIDTQKMQPGISCLGAFFVKESGIVNWRQVCQQYAGLFKAQDGQIFCGEKVAAIRESSKDVFIRTQKNNFYSSKYLITCGGLSSDRLVKMSGLKPNFKIIPFRGEYFRFLSDNHIDIKHLIYPVPHPAFPFLGVHFTPKINNHVVVGPNAVLALGREAYHWGKINIRDSFEIFTCGSIWKLIFKNFLTTIDQFHGSLFKKHYLKTTQNYFSGIQLKQFEKYPAGIRAQAIDKNGNFIQDFLFMESEHILHTCNAPSPAATSSLPIGRYIVDKFLAKLK